tara:strand:+ start:1800 stop:2372 length:573 start_codon:yes stop_codon:yes gene_type:complete
MKIEKDNLSPEQKRNVYISIFILILIIIAFFVFKKQDSDNRKKLLSANTDVTYCRVIGSSTYKTTQNHLEYSVNGKKYETRPLSSRKFNIGEHYKIEYSKSNPEISKVDYTSPVILDKNDYELINGVITEIFENDRLSVLSFEYYYLLKKYERNVILEKIGKLKKGEKIEIFVNKKNPKISYYKEQIKTY